MSIRIHKLAEELGMENKELMALLKARKIIAQGVKSVSSTVDNISASALLEEFASKNAHAIPPPAAPGHSVP
ncbi:MAG: translation initiation factor IF-2 N-terminal domain-containing protein, partial [Opitutus sp.]